MIAAPLLTHSRFSSQVDFRRSAKHGRLFYLHTISSRPGISGLLYMIGSLVLRFLLSGVGCFLHHGCINSRNDLELDLLLAVKNIHVASQ